jgi:hypothetical protein
MMTDQQREAAARELCRLRGVDPDECEQFFSPIIGERVRSVRWELLAAEIRLHEQMQAAIAAGMRSAT